MREQFKELQRRVKILSDLLADPHPGLMTWCTVYAKQMKWIVKYWLDVLNHPRP